MPFQAKSLPAEKPNLCGEWQRKANMNAAQTKCFQVKIKNRKGSDWRLCEYPYKTRSSAMRRAKSEAVINVTVEVISVTIETIAIIHEGIQKEVAK